MESHGVQISKIGRTCIYTYALIDVNYVGTVDEVSELHTHAGFGMNARLVVHVSLLRVVVEKKKFVCSCIPSSSPMCENQLIPLREQGMRKKKKRWKSWLKSN